MPVDHVCTHCQRRLAVPRRKAGVDFPCPHCGGMNFISKEEAAKRKAEARARRAEQQAQRRVAGAQGYDDVSNVLATAAVPGSLPQPMMMPGYGYGSPAVSSRVHADDVRELLLVSRQMVFFQVVLFVLLGPVAFGLGYWVGMGHAPADTELAATEPKGPPKAKVTCVGHVVVGNAPDVGAVIVALPADAKLERLLTARGLRPHDPLDKFSDNAELAIHQLGGDVVRTNNQGDFQLIVVPGRYRLLIISHKGLRRPGVQPVDLDVNEMKKYFDNVFDLVGPNQYRWSTEEFRDAMPPFGIRFD